MTNTQRKGGRTQEFDPEHVRDISEAVYRDRLGKDEAAKMVAKAKGDVGILRRNASSYDGITRSYLRVLKARGDL